MSPGLLKVRARTCSHAELGRICTHNHYTVQPLHLKAIGNLNPLLLRLIWHKHVRYRAPKVGTFAEKGEKGVLEKKDKGTYM